MKEGLKKYVKYMIVTVLTIYLVWFIFHNFIINQYEQDKNFVNNHLTVAVINLDRSPHRLREMTDILKEYGFDRIDRINAIDGKAVSRKQDLPTYEGLPCLSPETDNAHLTHTACYLSHLKALKYAMVESPTEWTLILEDDAKFYKNPKFVMKILSRCIRESTRREEIIWLTYNTSAGYLVNKEGAQLFYSYLNQHSDFTRDFKKNYNKVCLHDWAMAKVFEKIPYTHYPAFIGQREGLVSDITGNDASKSFISRLRDFFFSFEYY